MTLNDNIIPYVPIAPRVQASNPKSQLLFEKLFELIDRCVQAQFSFNHDTEKGHLSISPDQINDLLDQLSKNDQSDKALDIKILKNSLNDLIYPKFNGEHTISSPIWNNAEIRVWQFKLNQIAQGGYMENSHNDAELSLDMVMGTIRVWRNSLETGSDNRDVIYKRNDLIYKLMDLEDKLKIVQAKIEE
ncbi:hypothetical protein B9T36_02130 [Acinetobacter sp. ANC 4204]|uniref:hypothetical protein n=1 Tax=Acinetobacter sp. ANC 4204 TaxID=1977884 RepID=UPI000A3508A1|nr:hypothetical protein [Acinetobacter sp. ANC 4204]OTG61221.1 hypothetical protein B9T36_02130 [Acinetobacter sp. ANC 4204]